MYDSNLGWCLKISSLLGVHPHKQMSIFQSVQCSLILAGEITIIILTIVMLVDQENAASIEEITSLSVNLSTIPHAIMKMLNLYVQKKNIRELILMTKSDFWLPESNERTNPDWKVGNRLKTFMYNLTFLYVSFFIAKPILIGGDALLYTCYRPEWIPRYLFLIFEYFIGVSVIWTVVCNDVLILELLMLTQNQFRMLNEKIKNIYTFEENEDVDKIILSRVIECVDHRNLLDEFLDRFRYVFCRLSLIWIGNAVVSLCACMFIIMSPTSENSARVEKTLHLLGGLTTILCCYSIPAQEMMNEAEKLGESIYFSKWYEYPEYAKEYTITMLAREQKQIEVSAAGLVRIDMEMFMKACKSMYSFCMFLRTMTILDQ